MTFCPSVARLASKRDSSRQWRPRLATVALVIVSFGLWIAAEKQGFSADGPRAPNIVLILADDMGFSDLGCYGGEIRTPHLDSLAASGLRFSQFYNCALCGPSRAALMTGLHPHQVGVFNWTGVLDDRCVTAFELFKAAGYATCAAGRLDMVTAENWRDPASVAKYVDHFLGSLGGQPGPGNYFKAIRDKPFYRDDEPFTLPDEAYKTDLITDFAVEFITTAAAGDRPFFLYLSHYAPHWPLHAKPEDIAKYRRLYRTLGWDALRAGRRQRLVEQGLVDDRCRLAAREPHIPAWQDAANKDWEAERMAVYAAQVDCLDQGVGRVLDALRRTQADRNTLVIFLSDNGASDQAWTKPLDEPGRTWRLDGTPTRLGNTPRVWPGPADTFVTAGPAWAAVSNAPFRGHKATNYEGGIATPCIVWWPPVITQPGAISHELGHFVDILATCLDVAGIAYPTEFHGRSVQPPAGKSLLPIFRGDQRIGHRSLCWATAGCRAVRLGSWKLVSSKDGPWELYDLDRDRSESTDLAKHEPERVRQMARLFDQWRRRNPTNN